MYKSNKRINKTTIKSNVKIFPVYNYTIKNNAA